MRSFKLLYGFTALMAAFTWYCILGLLLTGCGNSVETEYRYEVLVMYDYCDADTVEFYIYCDRNESLALHEGCLKSYCGGYKTIACGVRRFVVINNETTVLK